MGYIYYSNNIKMPMPKCNDHRNDLRNINTDMMILEKKDCNMPYLGAKAL